MTSFVASPCIGICQLDTASQVCRGCFRTLEEIRAWGQASDTRKAEIVETARERSFDFAPWPENGQG